MVFKRVFRSFYDEWSEMSNAPLELLGQIPGFMAIYQHKANSQSCNEYAVLVQHNGKNYYCAFDGNLDACIKLIINDFKSNSIEWEE